MTHLGKDIAGALRLISVVMFAALISLGSGVVRAEPLQDARLVLETLANTAVKAPTGKNVAIPQNIASTFSAFDPVYHGFSIAGLSIEDHGGGVDGAKDRWLIGKVILENEVRRRAILDISTDYTLVNGTLSVVAADIDTTMTPFPKVDIYFVPQARNQAVVNAANIYEMLLRLVENAVPRDHVDPFGGTYFVYAATRERLGKDAALWVRFGDTPGGVGEAQNATQNYNFEGWVIASNSTPMRVNAGAERYIKVFLRLGPSAMDGPPITRMISLTGSKVVDAAALSMAQIKTNAAIGTATALHTTPSPQAPAAAMLAQGTPVGVVAFSKDGTWAYVIDGAQNTGYVPANQLSVR